MLQAASHAPSSAKEDLKEANGGCKRPCEALELRQSASSLRSDAASTEPESCPCLRALTHRKCVCVLRGEHRSDPIARDIGVKTVANSSRMLHWHSPIRRCGWTADAFRAAFSCGIELSGCASRPSPAPSSHVVQRNVPRKLLCCRLYRLWQHRHTGRSVYRRLGASGLQATPLDLVRSLMAWRIIVDSQWMPSLSHSKRIRTTLHRSTRACRVRCSSGTHWHLNRCAAAPNALATEVARLGPTRSLGMQVPCSLGATRATLSTRVGARLRRSHARRRGAQPKPARVRSRRAP